MKRIFFIHFLLLTLFFPGTQLHAQIPYDTQIDTAACLKRKKEKVKMKIRFEQKYDSVKGAIPKKTPLDTAVYYRYDREGREFEFCYYMDGAPNHVWYFYNAKGQLVRKLSCDADSSSGFMDVYEYNDKGQVKTATTYIRTAGVDEVLDLSFYQYNEEGLLAIEEEYAEPGDYKRGRFETRMTYTYDHLEREVAVLTVGEEGELKYLDSTIYHDTTTHDYESRGYYFVNGMWELRSYSMMHYDTLNNMIRSVHRLAFFRGGDLREDMYRDTSYYDFNDHLLEDRSKTEIRRLTFDANGEFLYCIVYNRNMQPLYKETEVIIHYK